MAKASVVGRPEQRVALVLDHHEHEAEHLACLFEQVGWSCNLVTDPSSAEDSLNAQGFSVVVLRDDFGEGSCEELVHRIESARPGQAVIVLQDTLPRGALPKKVVGKNSVTFLQQPVSEESLKHALRSYQLVNKKSFENFEEEFTISARELSEYPLEPETFERIRTQFSANLNEALQVELAFQEALANSFEHGCLELKSEWREHIGGDGRDKFSKVKEERLRESTYANRLIQIFLSITDDLLTVEIQDDGPGFPFDSSASGKSEEEVQCHGRGRQLMNLVMDEVEYSNGGRKITLKKQLV